FTSRAFSIVSAMPIPRAAAWDSRTYWAAVGLVSRTRIAILATFGMNSVTSCNRFAITSPLMLVMPVMLPTRPGEACDEAGRHRIEGRHKHDRDLARGVPRRQHRRRPRSQENVHAAADQLRRSAWHLCRALGQGEFDDEVAVLD